MTGADRGLSDTGKNTHAVIDMNAKENKIDLAVDEKHLLRNGFGGATPSKYVTRSVTTFAQPSQENKVTRKASNTKLALIIA
jgi:hypothetical protein